MNPSNRVKISPGLHVLIVLKKDQGSGKLTEGIVKDVLTKSPFFMNLLIHHFGIIADSNAS